MGKLPAMMILAAKTAPDVTSFYGAFTPLCFTLLGLWLVVVQTRHGEWRRSSVHRSRAYTLSINFALPGMMGLLSLVEPGNQSLWRAAFACVAIVALAILGGMALAGPGRGSHPLVSVLTTWFAVVIYAVVAAIALAPALVKDIGIHLTPLQVEEILLSVLVFTAVNVAWFLMFDEVSLDDGGGAPLQAENDQPVARA